MAKISRRDFIHKGSIGVAAAGAMLVVPFSGTTALIDAKTRVNPSSTVSQKVNTDDPIVIHIADKGTGEIHLYVGDQEIVHRDPALVKQLLSVI